MITIDDNVLGYLSNAIIITDLRGNILKTNAVADSIFHKCSNNETGVLEKLSEIDINSDFNVIPYQDEWLIGGHIHKVKLFPVDYEEYGKSLLVVFDISPILNRLSLNSILDYIDDAVMIINKEHVIEYSNKTFHVLSGIDIEEIEGTSLETLVRKNILEESLSLRVFKSKSAQSMRVKYGTGKTLIWSAFPLFDSEGEVEFIIGTGRDISELVKLETKAFKSERLTYKCHKKLKLLQLSRDITGLVYSSDDMKVVIDSALRASKSDSPVFIWGESGVGKELIANLIHLSSKRKMPFIAINCAAIPAELLESELFGYTEGAFTGALKGGKKGLFQEADGGTIFLDEIGDMPITMQSKLLRVLQGNEFLNIGGRRSIKINARIISSTNLPKDKLANNSQFRRDLFYRLAVIPIQVPPLRDRREDIPPLIDHFMKLFNAKYDTKKKLSGGLLRILCKNEWVGNVRELKNVIERLIIFSELDEIKEDDINSLISDEADTSNSNNEFFNNMPMRLAVHQFQVKLIKEAIARYGSVAKAAQILKIDASTVHRIKKNIDHQ